MRALRSVSDQMVIMVCEGYDPALDLQSPDSPNAPMPPTRGRGDSISSIDRDGDDLVIIQKVGQILFLHQALLLFDSPCCFPIYVLIFFVIYKIHIVNKWTLDCRIFSPSYVIVCIMYIVHVFFFLLLFKMDVVRSCTLQHKTVVVHILQW